MAGRVTARQVVGKKPWCQATAGNLLSAKAPSTTPVRVFPHPDCRTRPRFWMNIKLNPSNSVLTSLNQQRKFLHYSPAAFLIAKALKLDFLFGKIRLPQWSFVPLVIPKENHPVTLSDMGSDPDSIQDLARVLLKILTSQQKSTKKLGVWAAEKILLS